MTRPSHGTIEFELYLKHKYTNLRGFQDEAFRRANNKRNQSPVWALLTQAQGRHAMSM